jgi:hypothetical protein
MANLFISPPGGTPAKLLRARSRIDCLRLHATKAIHGQPPGSLDCRFITKAGFSETLAKIGMFVAKH